MDTTADRRIFKFLLWICSLIVAGIVWISMGKIIYPGIKSLFIQDNLEIPAGVFILLYCLAFSLIPLLTALLSRRFKLTGQIIVIILISLGARIAFLPMALSNNANHLSQFRDDSGMKAENPTGDLVDSLSIEPCQPSFSPDLLGWFHCSETMWKSLIILMDFIVIAVLMIELIQRKHPVRMVLIYSIHPLILTSFAGQGYRTVVLVAAMMISVVAWRNKAWVLMCLGLGVSLQYQLFPLFLLPFFINRRNISKLWILFVVGFGPGILFIINGGSFRVWITHILNLNSVFYGPLHKAISLIVSNQFLSVSICWTLFIICWLIILGRIHPARIKGVPLDITTAMIIIISVYFIFIPVTCPWTVSILVALLVSRWMLSVAILSLTISISYITNGYLINEGYACYPGIACLIIWIPFILLLSWEFRRIVFGRRQGFKPSEKHTIGVIIPTLNSQKTLERCITSIKSNADEITIVDGGSRDQTENIANHFHVKVYSHDQTSIESGGKGGQIHLGLIQSDCDISVIVNSNIVMEADQLELIRTVMKNNPEIVGGALGSEYEKNNLPGQIFESANDVITGFSGISYSHQIQFFRREWILASGLFPDIPLMEDLELSLRLRYLGPTIYLWGQGKITAINLRKIWWKRAMMTIRMTSAWLIHRLLGMPDPLALYKVYYRK